MKILAHRGYSANYPENTIIAFQEAAKLDIWGVEFDVHLTKDNQLVVIHDESIDRTSTGKGYVKDMTLEELRAFDYGSWFAPEFAGQTIPTLAETLAIFKSTPFHINIEIKSDIFEYPGIEALIANEIHNFNLEDRVIISSFNHESIARFQQIMPNVKTALLFASLIVNLEEYVKTLGSDAIHIPYYYGMRSIVRQAIKNGMTVRTYTVNDARVARQIGSLGIDAVFSDVVNL
ncbi:glycerophosphodiester phosphodiesterase [Solibacillus sp. FSL W7-1464]|uniref:glycerophosphodiester phosphodiesterase n=1 Tax=Solibacillus sp. FSL W7-1464 TaxID=2921706 RepID=UPI0030FCB946